MSAVTAVVSTARVVRIDRIDVVRLTAGNWRVDDDSAHDARFHIVHVVRGTVTVAHASASLREGDITVMHENGCVTVDIASDAELIVVSVPETAAGTHASVLRTAVGQVITADQGASGLVAHLLRGLTEHVTMNGDHAVRLAQHVVGLIGLMCLDLHNDDAWRSAMLREAVDYIEDHLGELDLTPDRIAAAQNISTRTLHRLFEREGMTLGAWIRTRRLENCRAELVDPRHVGTSVSAIGARWGLWDAAHFSRLFKATFGASPRSFRQAMIAGRELPSASRRTA